MPQTKDQVRHILRPRLAGGDGAARQMDARRRRSRLGRRQSLVYSEVAYENCTYRQSKIRFRNIEKALWHQKVKTYRVNGGTFNKILSPEMCIVTKTLHISSFS